MQYGKKLLIYTFMYNGIFEEDINAYSIELKPYTQEKELKTTERSTKYF